jgi:hypothetical protein
MKNAYYGKGGRYGYPNRAVGVTNPSALALAAVTGSGYLSASAASRAAKGRTRTASPVRVTRVAPSAPRGPVSPYAT